MQHPLKAETHRKSPIDTEQNEVHIVCVGGNFDNIGYRTLSGSFDIGYDLRWVGGWVKKGQKNRISYVDGPLSVFYRLVNLVVQTMSSEGGAVIAFLHFYRLVFIIYI